MPRIIIVKSQKPKNKRLLKVARDQNSVLYICLSFSVLHIGLSLPSFKFHIYMHQYTVFVFIFLAYFTLYNGLQFHLSHQKQISSPGWMPETSAQGWCTGKTQRDGMGREVGGGIEMGNTCKSMADSCQCMAKTTTIL